MSRCSQAPADVRTTARVIPAAPRDDHSVRPHRLGRAQEGPKILGILDQVKDEDERRLGGGRCPCEDFVEHDERVRINLRRDPMVMAAKAVELMPGQALGGYLPLSRQTQDLRQAALLRCALGEQYPPDAAPASP